MMEQEDSTIELLALVNNADDSSLIKMIACILIGRYSNDDKNTLEALKGIIKNKGKKVEL